jgi:hypothetical protein
MYFTPQEWYTSRPMDEPIHYPAGHNPKYWKKHPEALRAALEKKQVPVGNMVQILPVSPNSKPIDRWLGLGVGIVGLMFWLLPKTPTTIITCLFLILGMAIHPIWHFWWIEHRTRRRVGALIIFCIGLVLIGWASWSPSSYYALSYFEKRAFIAAIYHQKETKETLIVRCPNTDEAICVVATRYLEMFQRAGWKTPTGGIERGSYLKAMDGISIYKKPSGGVADPNNPDQGQWVLQSPSIVTLRRAFGKTHLKVTWGSESDSPENVITIYFGPVPEEN